MKFTIERKALKAALVCASKKEVRHYLNGVLVEYNKGECAMVVGTDGNILFAGSSPIGFYEGEKPFRIIIPHEAVTKALKVKSSVKEIVVDQLPDGRYTLGNEIFVPVDGRFPDYGRVIPQQVTGEIGQFNPDLLVRARDSLTAYYETKNPAYPMTMDGESGPAVMYGHDRSAIAVIMSIRLKDDKANRIKPRTTDLLDRSYMA